MLFAFNSNAYCNLVALLIIMLIPKITGITLAMASGFLIIIIPSIIVTIPYTMSSSLFNMLFVIAYIPKIMHISNFGAAATVCSDFEH